MQFTPRLPRDGINVSQEHPLKEATVLILGLGAVFAVLFVLLVWLVDIVLVLVPAKAEARVFASWDLSGLDVLADNTRKAPVQDLVDRLAAHWPDTPYDFRVGILPSEDPNAMALPGGLILVTDGLLDQVETENELALVLGHELGHFRHRDHIRRLGRVAVLGVAAAAVSRSASRVSLADTVGSLTTRGFGREDERRADRFGLELVQAEFGHVAGAWRFFERLSAKDLGVDGIVAYLSTHPGNQDRIEDLVALADDQGWSVNGVTTPLVTVAVP
jgi:predicted Zn-dependent protease